ncbi:MAG: peptide chain release factor-like protein [Candidatus Vidania fulgoroideorum]
MNFIKDECYLKLYSKFGGKDSLDCIGIFVKQYINFFNKNKIFYFIVNSSNSGLFLRSILFKLRKENIYNLIKNETGIYKIVRNSPFKKNNSIQTSYLNVFVYPKYNLKFKSDLKFDFFKSSGSGGQHANKTNSAVRVIHKPTGIKVKSSKKRSQIENKKLALKILNYKLSKYTFLKFKDTYSSINKNSSKKNKRIYYFNKSVVVDTFSKKKFNINSVIKGNLNCFLK